MRYRWRCLIALLLMGMIICTAGCGRLKHLVKHANGNAETDMMRNGYNIYYMNQAETKLCPVGYQLSSATEEGIILECLQVMQTQPESRDYKPVIAYPVEIERYEYDKDNQTLMLYFSKAYQTMSNTTEMLVRAAIVKTMAQFTGIIDYVSFNIGGEWLSDNQGNVLKMKNSDYISEVTGNLEYLDDADLKLYFASKDGSGLVRKNVNRKYYTTISLAAVILDALQSGPTTDDVMPILSTDTRVKSVYVKDGVCQVDFNQGFLEKVNDQNFILNVYGVVNSLAELDDVNEVHITVDGQMVAVAPDDVDLMVSLTARPDLVVEGE